VPTLHPGRFHRRGLWLVAGLVSVALLGCRIHAHRKPERIALRQWFEEQAALHGESDPAGAARALESRLSECDNAESLLTLADLCFRAAHRAAPTSIAERSWYRDAAVYAAFAAAAADNSELLCRAIDIHNRSVEHLIRSSQARRVQQGRSWQATFRDLDIALDGPPFLNPDRYADLSIAQDYETWRLQAKYGNPGVGVPLVARRDNDRAKPVEPADRFYSFHINAAATAVLHPGGTPADWRSHPTTLYFYDPFETCTVFLPSPRFGGEGMGVRGQAGGHSQC